VILNAAASLVVAGRAAGLGEGAALAASVLDQGRARGVLERAREVLGG
jgi:anthranilate phosphoribosyltransferase